MIALIIIVTQIIKQKKLPELSLLNNYLNYLHAQRAVYVLVDYGLTRISRLPKKVGLLFTRALQKIPIFCK